MGAATSTASAARSKATRSRRSASSSESSNGLPRPSHIALRPTIAANRHPMEFAESHQYVEYCESKNQYPPYNQKSGAFAPCSGHGHQIPAKDISVGTVPAGST